MNIRWHLAFVASLFICGGAFATSVTDDPVKGVITFDVDAGDTYTYDEAFPAQYNALVKTGAGRLVMTKPSGFNGKTWGENGVFIKAGVLEAQANSAIGYYNNTYISEGAQLYLNFEDGDHSEWSPMATYISGIAGSGPDGTGAIRIGSVVTSNWSSFVRNLFNLTGDATIQSDSEQMFGFNSNAELKLNGHTLTINGNGPVCFKNGVNQEGPYIHAGEGGKIVCNTPGWNHIYGSAAFIGDATASIMFTQASALVFNSLMHPIPWTIRIPNGIQFRADGSTNRACNILGPIEYKGDCSFGGTAGCPITFAGRIKFLGVSGEACGWSDGDSGLKIYFNSSDERPSKFSFSANSASDCHFLTDTSFPRWDAEDGFYYYGGPYGYDTWRNEIWLGEEGTNQHCTATGVARAFESYSSWLDFWVSRQLRFRTFGDFTADVDIGSVTDKAEFSHVGPGTLEFSCAFPRAGDGVGLHWRNVDTNVTVFSGCDERDIQTLVIERGTVEFRGGVVHPIVENGFRVGSSNDAVSACLKITDGARFVGTSALALPNFDMGARPSLIFVGPGSFLSANLANSSLSDVWGGKSAMQQFGDVNSLGWPSSLAASKGPGFWGLGDGLLDVVGRAQYLGQADEERLTRAVFQQDGGTNRYSNANPGYLSLGGRGDYLMRGGCLLGETAFILADADGGPNKAGDLVTFTMTGSNPVFRLGPSAWVGMNSRQRNADGTPCTTVVNLNAGLFVPNGMGSSFRTGDTSAYLNFNGGSLVWEADDGSFFFSSGYAPAAITIYEKGGVLDISGERQVFFSNAEWNGEYGAVLRPATGKGARRIRLPDDMPREGYVGIMPVRISGGDGEGMTAALDFDMRTGTVADELLITCPGINYTTAPTVIAYGPDYTTEYVCEVELTADDQVAGPLVKTGGGTFVLNLAENNAYAGPYVVSNGTLYISKVATIPITSKVYMAGGDFNWDWCDRTISSLGGYGTVHGCVDGQVHRLYVTDEFVVDAQALVDGRLLKINEAPECALQTVEFVAKCTLKVLNGTVLDAVPFGSYPIFRQTQPLSGVPAVDALPSGWKLKLGAGGRELVLRKSQGMTLLVK